MEIDRSRLEERERKQVQRCSHLDPPRQEESWQTKDYMYVEENCQGLAKRSGLDELEEKQKEKDKKLHVCDNWVTVNFNSIFIRWYCICIWFD